MMAMTWTVRLDGADLPERALVGGKAWSIARMLALGLNVPPAFVVTTRACAAYQNGDLPEGLEAEIAEGLAWLEAGSGRRFGAGPAPLLLSVRSGAAISMPGMMDTVLNLGITDATEAALAAETGQPAFARDTHRRFLELYAGIVLISPIVLRSDPQMGFAALAFLFATVWATDIFAYLTGRRLGGPLLAPRLSPKKTWSGAIGGLAGGVVAGALVAYASAGTYPVAAGVLALILSIAAQGGDLLESSVKRRFGAKDTSALIPGHGGVMDRVDGFLVAALIAVVIGALRFGAAASARGLLLW